MSMTDPIADMLTSIRNACRAKHRKVDVPASNMKQRIVDIIGKVISGSILSMTQRRTVSSRESRG